MPRLSEIGPACSAQVTRLDWVSHFLTHVDAPAHFIANGETIEQVALERWSGDAVLVQVEGDVIDEQDVPTDCAGKCVLFKTRNGLLWDSPSFREDYVYISGPAARLLASRGAKLVGVDYLTVDRWGDVSTPANYALLGAGVVILEGIDVRDVEPGEYELVAFPLKIKGCDGSPVRAALRPKQT